ncbi:MAG: hypothetical protein WCF33_04155, partial [Pseudonocardiaceae bacterium]
LVEGREAMALLAFPGLDAYQRQHRGADAHLDRAVAKLRLASAAYRSGAGCAVATSPAGLASVASRGVYECGRRVAPGLVIAPWPTWRNPWI